MGNPKASLWARKSGRIKRPPVADVEPPEEHGKAEVVSAQAIWAIFARVKYWSAKTRGPRTKPERPDEERLQRLAERMIDVFDETWRAGWRGEDLSRRIYDTLSARGG